MRSVKDLCFVPTYSTITCFQTTAHTLVFAFALLALYPDEQDRLYQEVIKYLPTNEPPVSFLVTTKMYTQSTESPFRPTKMPTRCLM